MSDSQEKLILQLKERIAALEKENAELQQTEELLRKSEERYRAVVNTQTEFVVRNKPDGVRTFVNEAYCRYFGISQEDAIGTSFFSLISEKDQEKIREKYASFTPDNPTASDIHQTYNANGQTVWQEWVETGIFDDDGNLVEIQAVGRDITVLIETEQSLHLLFRAVEQSPVSVVMTDAQGNIEYVNEKFSQVTGYTYSEAVGNNPRMLKSGRTPPEQYKELWQNLTNGQAWTGEFINKRKNGDIYWEASTISPVRNHTGEITHYLAVNEDVTDKKKFEEDLQQSEARYRDLFHNLPVPAVIHGNEKLLLVNQAFANLMGKENATTDDFIGRSIWDFIPEHLVELAESQLPNLYDQLDPNPQLEVQYVTDRGHFIDAITQGIPIIFDGKQAAQTIFIDITERKRTEAHIKQLNERFLRIFNASPAIMTIISLENGQYIEVNKAFENAFGYTRDEAIGHTTLELNLWVDLDERDRLTKQLISKGVLHNVECSFRTKSGDILQMIGSFELLKMDEHEVALAAFTDITEYKRLEKESRRAEILQVKLEKEQELVALKDRFISIVSHEFRTPLAIIQTSTDIVTKYADRIAPERRKQSFDLIRQQVITLTQMIDDVLTISRKQTGKIEFDPQPIDIEPYCRATFEQMQFADTQGHQFEFSSDSFDKPLMVDSNLMKHILSNLLSNAIKYSPEGSRIAFKLKRDNTQAIFCIQDDGIGIPEEDIDKLFDEFHRASNVGSTQGTGLGLSIVKEYVELHGGTITVESEIGKGSTFRFNIPL